VATRRWRTLQAALRPADRVRLALRSRGTAGAAGAPPPAPFIVGIARSGTTLLRLQLDAHSQVAIPPETGFGLIAGELARAGAAPEQLADRLTSLETWPDFGLDDTGLRTLLATIEPWSVGAGLRAVYRSYAARHGKPRWGDKTPVHYRYMDALAETLPEARFIHIIRDGRDVAASVGGLHFAPGDGSIEAAAADWRDGIVHARRLGAGLPQYHEIRYEHLVADPERTLREVCGFLELEFEPGMLSAHESARQRLNELPGVRMPGGTSVTREERLTLDGRTCEPPDPSRAGRWRTDLAPDAVARFEAVAGDLLAELGYDTRN
jgi:hypothetical protein